MSELKILERENWEATVNAPVAIVMLGKSDCVACNEWTTELKAFLETDTEFESVAFGKILLDKGGLGKFKKASPWLSEVHDLPTNVLYVNGEPIGFC